MDEAAWLASEDLDAMLAQLPARVGRLKSPQGRKFRLLCCALVRQAWHRLPHPASAAAVEAAERFQDGQVNLKELRRAFKAASRRRLGTDYWESPSWAAWYCAWPGNADRALLDNVLGNLRGTYPPALNPRLACHLLRDVFGNPFRPAALNPAALTPTVGSLARAAYEERELPSGHLDRARLAVLADALEEAGCTDQGTLAHLRGPGPHVRGCYGVDLILSKDR